PAIGGHWKAAATGHADSTVQMHVHTDERYEERRVILYRAIVPIPQDNVKKSASRQREASRETGQPATERVLKTPVTRPWRGYLEDDFPSLGCD
ncbi:hypothetical protein LTR91_022530, partial [Friedmanniomyces endolithicus]